MEANPLHPERTPELDRRHVVVTGGSRGIGAATVRALAAARASVSILGRGAERLEDTRRALERDFGGTHATFVADVTDPAAVVKAMAAAKDALGPIYGLVNNVGAAESAGFLETTDAAWRRMVDANLMSAVFCSRAVLPAMLSRRQGRIVNVASTAGLRGFRHVSAYAAAKHALVGLTRSLALEVARDGVTVNAVCPGYTRTELLAESARAASRRTGKSETEILARYAAHNAHGRLVEPAEVAAAVAWLCAPGQSGVTGQTLVIDGGDPW